LNLNGLCASIPHSHTLCEPLLAGAVQCVATDHQDLWPSHARDVALLFHKGCYYEIYCEALYRRLSSLTLIHAKGLMITSVCLCLGLIVNVFLFGKNLG